MNQPIGPLTRRIHRLPLPVEPQRTPEPRKPAWVERRDAGLLPGKDMTGRLS